MDITIRLQKEETKEFEQLMKGEKPNGDTIGVNRKHFFQNNKPWFPMTGEFHYSRYPNEYWKEALQKFKSGGLDTVSTYVFWIHHEEIEGEFKWKDNYDLRKFITLCDEVGLKVILRIGPWNHGEVRNGGYPDWLFKRTPAPGTNDDIYFKHVKILYQEIYQQVKGLFFKDNGPIIGIQIDNEYGHCHGLRGDEGKKHMMILKNTAVEMGFDVPIYTATGWGGAIVVEGEFIPLMAAYVEGSWEQHIDKMPPQINYIFTSVRDDLAVGSDLAGVEKYSCSYDINNYPFATCELGGGMQASYQRRPIITKEDTEAMAFVKLGSGAIMLGYYMYQGGTNPMGQLTSLQESRASGYPNDLPKLSYDYQAPLGEYGQRNPSYRALRRLHLFSRDQEEILTKSVCIFPDDMRIRPDDASKLRYSVRYFENGGFIFLNNYQHNLTMDDQNNLNFSVVNNNETINFPTIHLKSGEWRVLPFNLNLNGILLKCATMQPLTSLHMEGVSYFFYYGEKHQEIEYRFDNTKIKSVISSECQILYEKTIEKQTIEKQMTIKQRFSNENDFLEPIIIEKMDGELIHIITLTKEQAGKLNRVEIDDKSYIVLSDADTSMDGDQLQLLSVGKEEAEVYTLPKLPNNQKLEEYNVSSKYELFSCYSVAWNKAEPKVEIKEIGLSEKGHKQYQIIALEGFMNNCNDVYLEIEFEGDIAELTHNDVLKADWFYNGLTWRIGLKRFAKELIAGKWIIDISPLKEDAYVYLDKWPKFENGCAMKLLSYKVVPEYKLEK